MKVLKGLALCALLWLSACADSGRSPTAAASVAPGSGGGSGGGGSGSGTPPVTLDACGTHAYPSAAWTQCEQANYAKTQEALTEELDAAFQERWNTQSLANSTEYSARNSADTSWYLAGAPAACASGRSVCTGDPFRYVAATGADGKPFYDGEAEVMPVLFYDRECARLSGRVWKPRTGRPPFPGVVIQNGSVQAPENLYWWAAQALVRQGYVVLTFDPRGQGRSDSATPEGAQGSNANPPVFWEGLVDAIDFFRSSTARPYPHNASCKDTWPTKMTDANPAAAAIDPARLGIAGHSLGGIGVSVVQSYGAPGAEPWPGKMDARNPVKAVVGWDGLYTQESGTAGNAGGNTTGGAAGATPPKIVAQLPTLGINGEYGLTPQPFTAPPANPDKLITNFRVWQKAGVPAMEMTIRGGTHYEFSPLPGFPATSWCSDAGSGRCTGGWGRAMAEHYSLAWFDRWLKQPGEKGYDDADARLLDDNGAQGRPKMSFYFRSARDFPSRAGLRQRCEDIRKGCGAASS